MLVRTLLLVARNALTVYDSRRSSDVLQQADKGTLLADHGTIHSRFGLTEVRLAAGPGLK